MKVTVVRAIPLAAFLAVACFALSGVHRFKNAHHGLNAVVGEVVWLGFLVSVLALLVLVAVALYRRRNRGTANPART